MRFAVVLACLAGCQDRVVGAGHASAGDGGFGAGDPVPDSAIEPNPGPEICDGLDNDLDGLTDEEVFVENFCPRRGACAGSAPVCRGAEGWCCDFGDGVETEPAAGPCGVEVAAEEAACDGIDGDCDGLTDETFDFCGVEFCGACAGPGGYGEHGRCDIPHAVEYCDATWCGDDCRGCAVCRIEFCLPGYETCDGEPPRCGDCGCGPPGPDICDGIDSDCDGLTDEDAKSPNFCPQLGACAESAPVCRGVKGWCCDFDTGVEMTLATVPCGVEVAAEEAACDGIDGDCDGLTDEPFDLCGVTHCGACRGAGEWGGHGACAIPNANVVCDSSACTGGCEGCAVCAIGSCRPGHADCQGDDPPNDCDC